LGLSLVVGVAATFAIWYTGHIKEKHWDREREHSKERIAVLDNETELLTIPKYETRYHPKA
jgi:hypothetical protein